MSTLKNINLSAHFVLTLLLCCFCIATSSAATKYVKPTGNDSNNGNSWAQAYQTLQKALEAAAASGDEIWIAAGTYYPSKDETGSASPSDNRKKVFYINKDVAIYGGFNGTETARSQRNWNTNIVTLSGDIGTIGSSTDNCYHVVKIYNVSNAMTLNGVQITGGNASASGSTADGIGGGIIIQGTDGVSSSPLINNCRIYANSASNGGGVGAFSLNNGSSIPDFFNCIIDNNNATGVAGGVYNFSDGNFMGTPFSVATFEHCTFYENNSVSSTARVGYSFAADDGGASLFIINSIAWGSATGVYFSKSTFGATHLQYSLSKGGCNGNTNCVGVILSSDPLFVNAAGGNLRLNASSPAIDVAGTEYFNSPSNVDYDNNPRPVGCTDYGAFEYTTSSALTVTCYRDLDGDGYGVPGTSKVFCTSCGTGWADNTNDCDDSVPIGSSYAINQSGAFAPLSGTGTTVTLADDEASIPIPIGFNFRFYGVDYSQLRIVSNGFISFDLGTSTGCCSGQLIPNNSSPNNLIAIAWDDLYPPGNGSISYFTTGSAPNRKMAINFNGVPVCCGSTANVTSQVILYETTNVIEIHSADINGVNPATMGIENANGTEGFAVSGRNASSWAITNDFVSFTPVAPGGGGILTTYYRDLDGDGFGNPAVTQQGCSAPSGYVASNTDCNDNNFNIKPTATEVCDGVDNDCDGSIDEGVAPITWYRDMDGDGFGNAAVTQTACTQPTGYVANSNDCNDNNFNIKPTATEVCDGVDNDCDGSTDEGVLTTYYRDMDGDTFGNSSVTQQACSQPTGYVTNNTDCDDNDPLEKPGQVWYDDSDNDGYGQTGAASITSCLRPTNHRAAVELLATSGDCNDNNFNIKPSATEVCDGVDNNCNGSTDEGCTPDYTITTTGNAIVITDSTGSSETLAVSQSGSNIFLQVAGRTYALNGGTVTAFPVGVPLSGVTSITINTAAGNDVINIGNFTVNLPSLTINGGAGDDTVNFNGDINFVTNANLDLDMQNDHASPGVDQISISSNANLILTGMGEATVKVSKSLFVGSEGSLKTQNGNLTLEANQQATPTSGIFVGIHLDRSLVECTGSGELTIQGKGGTSASGRHGVLIVNTTQVKGGTGAVSITGVGGNTTSSGSNDNIGVYVQNAQITSSGGAVTVNGTGGGSTSAASNTGVYLELGGEITAGGMGSVSVTGTGRNTTGNLNLGIVVEDPGSKITSSGGNVTVIGTGGGSGNSNFNHGVLLRDGGEIKAGAAGTVTVEGYGGNAQSSSCAGVLVSSNSKITSSSGAVYVKGSSTIGSAPSDIYIESGGMITSTSATAGITLESTNNGVWPHTSGADVSTINTQKTTFSAGSKLNIDIDGLTANTQYQQLSVVGMIDLNSASLTFAGSTFTPTAGNTFTIVANDGTDQIIGTFNGLAEGAYIPNFLGSTLSARITYVGGTNNNDVVLTVVNSVVCYADTDADGFGDPNSSMTFNETCGIGFVSNNTDCDDTNDDLNPNTVWYLDADGDGYYTGASVTQCASPGAGYRYTGLTAGGDCNDGNAAINPAATEVCDGVDNDCDSSIDEGVQTTYYRDSDGDGFGNPANTTMACSLPTGYVINNTDCDDTNDAINPNTIWYLDADNDNYYTGAGVTQCASPGAGYRYTGLLGGSDCNDSNAAIKPGATEVCNGIDDDCDGTADDGITFVTYYQDSDGDTFGNPAVSQSTCNGAPTGYVANNTDCDDTNDDLNPNTVWYLDADNDNYYTGAGVTQCASPGAGYRYTGLLGSGDCNDGNAAINPAAAEICDGIDNDCDGSIDEGVQTTYYRDMDGDGFGNPVVTTMACSLPTGYVANNTDCDDTNDDLNPNTVWYLDADGDGYYTGASVTQCASPGAGYRYTGLLGSGDCNDGNAAINPAAAEICDGIDNDCDGSIDEGVQTTYYRDMDGDGFGNPVVTTMACSLPTGYVANNTDCDDTNDDLNPNTVWYLDADGDGYYTGASVTQCASPGAGYRYTGLLGSGDCNDGNAAINPAATEVCDGIDDNCDGSIDEGCIPDYIITTTGNGIIITDITGSSETLEMSQSGGDINFNVAGRTYSLDGGFVTAFPVNVPLAGATFITINTETGNDIINIGAFTAVLPSLTVNGGTDDDVVNFNGDITFAANANLDVDLQNDHTTPGVDQINILTGNNILLSGTGSVMMTASLNIFLDNNARIETTNGNLTLEANQQPVASTGYFIGINLFSGAIIRSVNGAVSLAGRGGTADGTQYGIENMGTIATTGTGNILLEGTGGLIGTDNDGVRNIGTISATGSGDIQITGTSTGSAASEAFANQLGSAVSTTSGDIKVDADIIYIDPTSSISAGANKVSIAPTTAGRSIDLGLDDSFTQLGLTDAELDRITAGTLVIGNAGSGAITVSAAITRPAATNMQLISNSNVTIADGGINTAGGTILLDPGAFPATVRPTFNGTDVTAGTLSFGGDLTIVINNTTAGSGYRQLNVSGVVNITGVDLRLDGSYSPSGGETFTIVDNDGSADAIIGTFNGLPQGATITNFLGSNFNATISYTGGNGNDVVITVINNVVCYADTDGDGFGDPNNSMTFSGSCGTGFVSNADDCDDSNNALNPNTVWYLDADNDNYYTGSGVTQCASPGAGYRYTGLTAGGDCNDNNAAINPAASEVCDGIDNDCNGMIDDGLSFVTYYQDSDGDTFGNPAVSQSTCDGPPTGYVSNNLDCNDSNSALNPNTIWYLDADGDNYYTGSGVTQCTSPGAGYRYTGLTAGGDCNDNNAAINPAASEVCDGIDNDCNGMIDDGLSFVTYYQDSDGDTFGNPAVSQSTCDGPPTGYVSNNLDCNDSNNAVNPNTVWYLDADGDNYYTGSGVTQCASPGAGYRYTGLLGSGDCNDGNAAINPAATEVCDGVDNDCDGLTDIDDPDLMSTPLQLSCPTAQTLPLNSTCSASLPDYRSLANLSGGCGIVTVTQMPLPGSPVSQAGSLIVTIMASDQSGNTQSCTFTVNKLDVTPPSVTCFNGTVSFNGQSSIALDADALSDSSDGCGIQSISLSPAVIYATQVGQNVPVTVTATDLSGNTASCISTVSVSGLPEGWSQTPDGVGCAGGNSNSFNPANGVWTATSTNCFYASPFTQDASSFAQRTLCGNGSITALVASINGNGWAGVVMRESNAPGAKKAQLMTNLSQFHRREFRTAANGQAFPQQIPSNGRYWLRIVRAGNQFSMFASPNGTSWFLIGSQSIIMGNCIDMGLVATNYTTNSTVTATFEGVSYTGTNVTAASHVLPASSLGTPHQIEVYPNPTDGALNVDLTSYTGRAVRLEVYSLEGKLLKFKEIDEVQTTLENLDLSQYANGMYFIKVSDATRDGISRERLPAVTKRVVLQRD